MRPSEYVLIVQCQSARRNVFTFITITFKIS